MAGVDKARRLRVAAMNIYSLYSFVPVLFWIVGILCGFVFSGRCPDQSALELQTLLDGAGDLSQSQPAETLLRTLVCFFRAPVFAFLLGFASIGVVLLPLLYAAQGFVLSFSMFSFARAIGRESFPVLFKLFGLRLLFVLPVTLVLGEAALEKSVQLAALVLGGNRLRPAYGISYWYRMAVCVVLLLLGSALELYLLPPLLAGGNTLG